MNVFGRGLRNRVTEHASVWTPLLTVVLITLERWTPSGCQYAMTHCHVDSFQKQ